MKSPTASPNESTPAGELSAAQREHLKRRLIEERSRLVNRRGQQLRDAIGDGPDVGDEMDAASRSEDQATLLGLAAEERERLGEIERALAKFDRGEYGVDEESGEPIGYPRLEARPWARHTVAYEEQLERQARLRRG